MHVLAPNAQCSVALPFLGICWRHGTVRCIATAIIIHYHSVLWVQGACKCSGTPSGLATGLRTSTHLGTLGSCRRPIPFLPCRISNGLLLPISTWPPPPLRCGLESLVGSVAARQGRFGRFGHFVSHDNFQASNITSPGRSALCFGSRRDHAASRNPSFGSNMTSIRNTRTQARRVLVHITTQSRCRPRLGSFVVLFPSFL